jgi:hypothetical protein
MQHNFIACSPSLWQEEIAARQQAVEAAPEVQVRCRWNATQHAGDLGKLAQRLLLEAVAVAQATDNNHGLRVSSKMQ